ncbi:pyridoxal-phosphate dependent enzyme [Actinoplanes sp. NPDC049265]|uniref:pyridoxal-phosphate dependent enzyme n=1 Tax=Actinoplanes sp. NPDC049265 TaxID=3363902 RepID=UPI003713BF01
MSGAPGTALLRLRHLEGRLRLFRVYAKCEMRNPTGTHKDRVADGLVLAAIRSGAAGVTVGSCGNLGVALTRASLARGLSCTVFVPGRYRHTRADEITGLGARVRAGGDSYEAAVEASRDFARASRLFDANPVGRAGRIAIRGYGAIVDELVEQCPAALGSIWVPVGNGTCAAGIHARCVRRGQTVRIGVVGSAGNTAVTASLAAGRLIELDAARLRDTEVNEPLVNWRSLHAREAMDAVGRSGGYFCEATDEQLVRAGDELSRETMIRTSPAGAAGLVGLRAFADRLDPARAHVVLLTG